MYITIGTVAAFLKIGWDAYGEIIKKVVNKIFRENGSQTNGGKIPSEGRDDNTEKSDQSEKSRSIAILGMPGAGKTTLLHFLQGLPESKEVFVTPDEGLDYNEYIYCKKDGTKVPIASGKDISGVEYAQKEYPPLIRGNDIILFLFSLKKYAFDSSYKAKVQSRLDLIKALLERKKLIVFLTFEEEFGIETQVREKESLKAYRQYQHEIGAKTYAAILEYPHHIISLKYGEDKSKLKMIIDQFL